MATEEVIVYDYDTIRLLASEFHAELDEDTINNLLEIKKNNRFIRRKSPLRLKYKISTANTWRNERENSENIPENEKLTNSIISNLNKLSEQNFEVILGDISKLYNEYKDDEEKVKLLISCICSKAMTEKIYSNLYSKLINELDNSDEGLVSKFTIIECETFFEKNIENNIQEIKENIEDYDKICEIIKIKSEFIGGFVFIANLYKYNIVKYEVVERYYKSLLQYTNISPKDFTGKYIDAIVSIIDSCGSTLECNFEEKSDFRTVFMEPIYELIKDKKRVSAKYRFKLMDIIEKYENNWTTDNDGWKVV